MPLRQEHLIWLHGAWLDATAAAKVDEANESFVAKWDGCAVDCRATVKASGLSDRLWLFRLKSADQKIAAKFRGLLDNHIRKLQPLKLKRRVNLPTPLLTRPEGYNPKLDIGLHVGLCCNATLMLFFYWERGHYNPPHLQLADMHYFHDIAGRLWAESACPCHRLTPSCDCGDCGCFKCFQVDCDACDGTGWKGFARWQASGCRIDYTSRWPIALIDGEA
jgi:hypothetical protein